MHSGIVLAALVVGVCPSGADDTRLAARTEELAARLREKAAETAKLPTSELFDVLTRGHDVGPFKPTAAQADLAGRLDLSVRDVIQGWLIRGLDKTPLPSAAELADRLGKRGDELKRAVTAHAEAIASQMILTPSQAALWSKRSGQAPAAVLPGRYEIRPVLGFVPETPKQLLDLLRSVTESTERGYASSFLMTFFGAFGPAWAGASAEQGDSSRRLDAVTRDVIGAWLRRGLDSRNPPVDALLERVDERGSRRRASVVAHCEAIVLEAVLDHDQAESYLQDYWRATGVRALLDPELARRLGMTRLQQSELRVRLDEAAALERESSKKSYLMLAESMRRSAAKEPGSGELEEQNNRQMRQAAAEGDAIIWDVLTPFQKKKSTHILGIPDERRGPPPKIRNGR